MVNYENSKVYKLCSDQSDCFYIGSTIQTLRQRLINHRTCIKREKSGTHISMKNHTNIGIKLIEKFPCSSKEELLEREGFFIRQYREQILNNRIEGRTQKEYEKDNYEQIKENHKAYYEANSEKLLERQKAYYEANSGKKKEKVKAYREANRQQIKEQKKAYFQKYREEINRKTRESRRAKKITSSASSGAPFFEIPA
jgi:predicted S18 family serine protease